MAKKIKDTVSLRLTNRSGTTRAFQSKYLKARIVAGKDTFVDVPKTHLEVVLKDLKKMAPSVLVSVLNDTGEEEVKQPEPEAAPTSTEDKATTAATTMPEPEKKPGPGRPKKADEDKKSDKEG